jgi:hypothetical protein
MPRIRTPSDGSTHFRLSSIHAIRQQGADSPTAQVRSFETCGGGRAGERQGSVSQTGSCSITRFCGRVSRGARPGGTVRSQPPEERKTFPKNNPNVFSLIGGIGG